MPAMTTADYGLDELLRVLADPLRLHIVRTLASEQLCTCHLVEMTGARQTNISNHLRVLREAGVIDSEPSGRYTYYRLNPDALDAVSQQLHELAQFARSTTQVRRPCD